MTAPRTLYDKLWDTHVVHTEDDGTTLLYVDRHLIHDVTSPQPFEAMRRTGRPLRRPSLHLAVAEHNVPTTGRDAGAGDALSRTQIAALESNSRQFGLRHFTITDARQGIVHVIGPEQGFTMPGSTLVCGDSHTSTHGALACLAFGIGTTEIELVLATQCIWTRKAKAMAVKADGALQPGVYAKDLALHTIGRIGMAGATGHALEFMGSTVAALSIEARLTLCNMAIEAGARSGLIAADETTIRYLAGRPLVPSGDAFERAAAAWRGLVSDPGAKFDKFVEIDATAVEPQVTWGTLPDLVVPVGARVPDPGSYPTRESQQVARGALEYMGLEPGMAMTDIGIDKVFIGSCTNSRIEDLRAAASVLRGRRIAGGLKLAMVVPGSTSVKKQAEAEGLAQTFVDAGFEWRESGCSMCVGLNADRLEPRERCASTSNRNFEGRQGVLGRTHLVSPAMAAAAAVAGHFVDVRELVRG
jgi:3-isopropylmalate/(R)-2-methylmalate dehydratase large subunit